MITNDFELVHDDLYCAQSIVVNQAGVQPFPRKRVQVRWRIHEDLATFPLN